MSKIKHLKGWKPDRPDRRDKLFGVHLKPKLDWGSLPTTVDLRPKMSPVEDQSSVGSCTANAIVGALEYNENKFKQKFVDLSRLFLYYNERVMEGTTYFDAGAYIRDGVKSAADLGVCEEKNWPYKVDVWDRKPKPSCYANAKRHRVKLYVRITSFEDILHALADGYPVVFGATLYPSFETQQVSKTGVVPMPGPNEKTIGGHAMLLAGYDMTKKQFLVRNSWGTGWGQNGYCVMPFDYFKTIGELVDDLWIIKI